jgi:predicted nuclease of predicted toxin-antitoxin system
MARLYADEQFPSETSLALRFWGHDVLTVQEADKANQRIPDPDVLAFATQNHRAVLTINRYDFIRLHKISPHHAGIIACTENTNFERLAKKIHDAITQIDSLDGQLIRIYRDA